MIQNMAPINLGDYATSTLCKFRRSFDGSTSDGEPSATASNNYQTNGVMNGSKIGKFRAKVHLSAKGSSAGIYLDVYLTQTSFSDALYADAIYDSSCPVDFNNGTDVWAQGEVGFKVPIITWTENNYKSFKGIQRITKFIGTVFLSSEDGGTPSAEFMISQLPAKCRRSQTGMFFGLMLHYSSTKNSEPTANVDASVDISFDEYPASNRLPFKW